MSLSVKKGKIILVIKLLISVGIIYYLISFISLNRISESFVNVDLGIILIVLMLALLNLFFQFQKWKLICNSVLGQISSREAAYSLFYGLSAGLATPGRVGEYFGRAIYLKEKGSIKVTLATLVDKIFPLYFVSLIGLTTLLIFLFENSLIGAIHLYLLVILSFMFHMWIIYWLLSRKRREAFIFRLFKNVKFINKIREAFAEVSHNARNSFPKILLLSLLFYLTYTIQLAFLFLAFGEGTNLLIYLQVSFIVFFLKSFLPPVTIGDLGVREGVSVYFIERIGEAASVGFNASILLFTINLLFPALAGLVLSFRKK